jgi:hypothetical protein
MNNPSPCLRIRTSFTSVGKRNSCGRRTAWLAPFRNMDALLATALDMVLAAAFDVTDLPFFPVRARFIMYPSNTKSSTAYALHMLISRCVRLAPGHALELCSAGFGTRYARAVVAQAGLEPASVSAYPIVYLLISLRFPTLWGHRALIFWGCPHFGLAANESPWTTKPCFQWLSPGVIENSRCYRTLPDVSGVGTAGHRILELSICFHANSVFRLQKMPPSLPLLRGGCLRKPLDITVGAAMNLRNPYSALNKDSL